MNEMHAEQFMKEISGNENPLFDLAIGHGLAGGLLGFDHPAVSLMGNRGKDVLDRLDLVDRMATQVSEEDFEPGEHYPVTVEGVENMIDQHEFMAQAGGMDRTLCDALIQYILRPAKNVRFIDDLAEMEMDMDLEEVAA